jgi:hypothetical protein
MYSQHRVHPAQTNVTTKDARCARLFVENADCPEASMLMMVAIMTGSSTTRWMQTKRFVNMMMPASMMCTLNANSRHLYIEVTACSQGVEE